jgi:hypothetical protein
MRSLQVTALLGTPVALPRANDVHLDGLLAWAWLEANRPELLDCISAKSTREEIVEAPIPLARIDVGEHRIAVCSAWSFSDDSRLTTGRWTRRKDGEDMGQRARPINASSPERPQLNRADVVEARAVIWFAWGEPEPVQELLSRVSHIGGLRGMGYGKVIVWAVEEGSFRPEEILVFGESQRNLPIEAVVVPPAPVPSLVAVQPPYWAPCMQTRGYLPGVELELAGAVKEKLRALQ